jgi:hypothetical protein
MLSIPTTQATGPSFLGPVIFSLGSVYFLTFFLDMTISIDYFNLKTGVVT